MLSNNAKIASRGEDDRAYQREPEEGIGPKVFLQVLSTKEVARRTQRHLHPADVQRRHTLVAHHQPPHTTHHGPHNNVL